MSEAPLYYLCRGCLAPPPYSGTSLVRNCPPPLGPPQGPRHYPTARSQEEGRFLMGEASLYSEANPFERTAAQRGPRQALGAYRDASITREGPPL